MMPVKLDFGSAHRTSATSTPNGWHLGVIMDRGWIETIEMLGVDMMFAVALAMLLAEQVRLVLRRALARRRMLLRQQGTRTAESAVTGTGRVRPTANDSIDVTTWPLRVWRHNH
jgi:hypothetical protein